MHTRKRPFDSAGFLLLLAFLCTTNTNLFVSLSVRSRQILLHMLELETGDVEKSSPKKNHNEIS